MRGNSAQTSDGLLLAAGDINDLYLNALQAVLQSGIAVSPRGLPTREVRHAVLQLRYPRRRLVTIRARRLNAAFAVAEWLFTMIGTRDGSIPLHYNSKIGFLVETPPTTFEYSYGSRLRSWDGVDQLISLRNRLVEDKDTRRATAVLWNPKLDNDRKDNVPCITCLQFMLREGHLDLTVYMRSNDLILGFVYDVFTFSLLLEVMAGWLDAELGTYTHIANSLHIYDKDVSFAQEVLENRDGADFYDHAVVQDLRLPMHEFRSALQRLVAIEEASRRDPLSAASNPDGICESLPTSWRGMAYCLLAYNCHRCSTGSDELRRKQFQELLARTDPHYGYVLKNRYGPQHDETP